MRALAALALLVAWPGAARAEAPLCRAQVLLASPRAYVGQPVLHRVRIEQRREVIDMRWETSLSFPAFRVEQILGPGGPREHTETTETLEERRVLFPARAGRLALPPARIACESAARLETAEVPAAELVALEPPREGRPADWAGLIGPVEITSYATPDRVALGESVSIAVTITGATNVWTAPVALAGAFRPDVAELFERPNELARDMGRTLGLRSYRSFDLVPRRAGVLEIPELRVAYFDPAARRYAEARAPALRIEVVGRRDEPAAPAQGEPPAAERAPSGPGALAAAGVALALGLGAGLWLGRRAWPLRRSGAAQAARGAAESAREALDAALARGDAAAAAAAATRALRLGLERALPGARSLAVEELAARAPREAQSALALLARLERARFGGAEPTELLMLAREARAADR